RCVSDFNPRQGGPPSAVTLAPGSHARAVAIGDASRGTRQGGPPIPINQSEDVFLKRMSEEAQQRGWSLENAVDRNRLITILRASEPETVPLLGTALVEAQRLGGPAQYWHLREVAKKLSLSLDRANDRAFAERQMYAERGRTLQTAEVYEEAAAAVIRREGLNFAEAKAKRRAAEIVFAARPDLVGMDPNGAWAYGTHPALRMTENDAPL